MEKLKIKNKRSLQLDALRGIAALSVFVSHMRTIYPNKWTLFEMSPLRIFSAGHSAVILFFILSGYVLSLQLLSGNISYKSFLTRRFFRIYIPYIISIAFAVLLVWCINRRALPELSIWARTISNPHISLGLVLNHILMIGSFPNYSLNPVIWTLIVEMRMAIIFPFLFLFIQKKTITFSLTTFFLLSLFSEALNKKFYLQGIDFFETVHYILFFAAGILLAKYKSNIVSFCIQSFFANWIFIVGLFLYAYGSLIAILFQNNSLLSFITQSISDWVIGIGAIIIMSALMSNEQKFRFLERGIFQFFGKISFSFYLYHAIILIEILNLFYSNPYSLLLLFPMSFLVSILIASLSYKYIELPVNILGKKIVYLFENR